MSFNAAEFDWRKEIIDLIMTHSTDVMSGQTTAEVLAPVLQLAMNKFGCCLAHAWSVDPRRERLVLVAQSCRQPVESVTIGVLKVATTLSGRAFETRQPQIHTKQAASGPFWQSEIARQLNIQSFISLPIRNIGNPHQVTMIVNLYFQFEVPEVIKERQFNEDFRRYSTLLASNFESNLRERAFRMSARVSRSLARVELLTPESGCEAFARCVRGALQSDWVTVYLENWNQSTLNRQADDSAQQIEIPKEEVVASEITNVWRTNREFLSTRAADEPAEVRLIAAEVKNVASAILVPLHDVKGRCKGVVRSVKFDDSTPPNWRRSHSYDEIAIVESMERAFAPPLDMLLESQARDTSLQNLSHELRVPVVALRAVVERMQREYDEAQGWFKFRFPYFTEVNTFTDVMQRLLKRLEITRLGPDRVPMIMQRTRLLSEVIQPAIRYMQPILRQHGMTTQQISHFGFEPIVPIDVDRALLTQVVFNLLDNSVKYFPKSKSRSEFKGTVVCNAFPGKIEIIFGDNGQGIAESDKERIFEFGYRSEGAEGSNVQGSGLGCWLAREIATRHDGRLWVRSCSPLELVLELPHPRNRKTLLGLPPKS